MFFCFRKFFIQTGSQMQNHHPIYLKVLYEIYEYFSMKLYRSIVFVLGLFDMENVFRRGQLSMNFWVRYTYIICGSESNKTKISQEENLKMILVNCKGNLYRE